jgi:hypothetical protein
VSAEITPTLIHVVANARYIYIFYTDTPYFYATCKVGSGKMFTKLLAHSASLVVTSSDTKDMKRLAVKQWEIVLMIKFLWLLLRFLSWG